jgi:Arc/MetJ-type ribon-helix-helix transcriptional regulator
MQISINNPDLARFVEEQVKSGRFATPTAVVEAGLERLMLDPMVDELDAEDLAAIEESEQQIARGEDLDWNEVSARLRKKYLSA